MAIIKKDRIVEKGIIDLRQAAAGDVPSDDQNSANLRMAAPVPHMSTGSHTEEQEDQESQFSGLEAEQSAEEAAGNIMAEAEAKAQEVIETAYAEAESIRAKAKEEAEAEGRKEGEQKVAEYVTEAFETLNSAIEEKKKVVKDSEQEILRLSLKIAEQILRSEVTTNKDAIMNMIVDAVNRVSDRDSVIVKVNREDLEYVKKNKEKIAGIVDGIKNLSIVEDSQVEQGGCVIETNLGYVDARLGTKLELIEKAFKKAG